MYTGHSAELAQHVESRQECEVSSCQDNPSAVRL